MSDEINRPNILFVFSDQQRDDTIGFEVNGNKVTPVLESLADEGVKFSHTFTCQPVCGPARACIQTGTYATENHVFRNGIGLDAQSHNKNNTIATWFKNAGYDIGYIGKWHLATNSGPADIDIGNQEKFHNISIPKDRRGGWDEFWIGIDALEHSSHGYNGMKDLSWNDGPNPKGFMFDSDGKKVEFSGYRVDAQTNFVLDYIESRSNDKPWFLFTSYIEPHHQNDRGRYEGPEGSKERFSIKKEEVPKDLWGADWLNKGDWEENYPDYLGQCWSLDKNMARMIDKLKEKGMYENTVIIYTSDHGSHFRTREGEYKRNCTDGCLRIPLIIRGPGFLGGKVIDSMVSLIDIVPTILNAANISIPEHVRGNPLQILTKQEDQKDWPDSIFAQISDSQVGRCIRTKKWKYSVRAPIFQMREYSKSHLYFEEFLFDLEEDPYELNNLVISPKTQDIRNQLKNKLIKWIFEIENYIPIIKSKMDIPEPPVLNEGGILIKNEDQNLVLRIGDNNKMLSMDIPLDELMEEILNIPLILEFKNKKISGFFNKNDEGPTNLEFVEINGDSKKKNSLSVLLSDGLNHKVLFNTLLASAEKRDERLDFNPKYHIFVMIDK